MKKKETRILTVIYCDVCNKEINDSFSYGLESETLQFHFHTQCQKKWDEMGLEEKSMLIVKRLENKGK